MNVFKNKTTRFLTTSLIAVVLLCVCVFSFLTVHMNYESTQTINQVGTLYMSNMSQQISMHFATTISLRLDQLDAMTTTLPSERLRQGRPPQPPGADPPHRGRPDPGVHPPGLLPHRRLL